MRITSKRDRPFGYELFMLVLCLYAMVALGTQALVRLDPDTSRVLDGADAVVCALFLLDFLVTFYKSPDRPRYFFKEWGWIDLLSSIPTFDLGRVGRTARVFRAIRLLRGLRGARIVALFVYQKRATNSVLAATVLAGFLMVFCCIAIMHVETDPESNIKSADDALWWAFATITTVGYGDRYPVTGEGCLIASVLMAAGMGLVGVFAAFLTSWFMGRTDDDEMKAIRVELESLRRAVENSAVAASRNGSQGVRTVTTDTRPSGPVPS